MKMKIETAVAFLVALGFSKAGTWSKEKLAKRLSMIPDKVAAEDVPEAHKGTYNGLIEAEGKVELEGDAGGDEKSAKGKSKKEKKPRGESKCSYIDSLLEKGGLTMSEIAKKAAEKFNANLDATLATVRARPAHMRAAGRKPKWVAEAGEEPKKKNKKSKKSE